MELFAGKNEEPKEEQNSVEDTPKPGHLAVGENAEDLWNSNTRCSISSGICKEFNLGPGQAVFLCTLAFFRKPQTSIHCSVQFRPCIDIHKGKVKQIVGSTLQDLKGDGSNPVTNFESDKSAAEYADLYKEDGLTGGHVIMLGADPLSKAAALEALHAYPGGLQVGGGINSDNCLSYIDEGASHVIVTSYVFNNGQMDLERLKDLVRIGGRQGLVLDLSCRKTVGN
ncbi:1-(5-phosphoribosyl)-5-[(5-phosphoribosylamino)methylideneamino] imidazole-4-carboxamide isomerase, chloroplastic-like [Prosopis cineraria]|uniref:1-(5-phosphoribosyl)-5-[(5- phosphoribosylamino)methylideneamino] imidazole-4-carboxamide isomerase, chloroplastic-like n=1 Tax=Prosopis cineraria TaxID=364024 RepID=UPI00240EDDD8|nr:1-(5-phosphoribosyl)-5-[(5-phosphoribosylamino)methylideneamino] imidazole-4-carboxamide isomerase, chloroplastic-like [Prosopis cineraria]